MTNLLETLSKMVGGTRSRQSYRRSRRRSCRHGGSACSLAEPQSAGKRRRRMRSRRRTRSSKRGGFSHKTLSPAPVGGRRRRRSRRHRKKSGGSQLVPLGLLGALLSVGKGHMSKKRGKRTKKL